ncbi:MAG: PQQ-dependent sugar dehydrogenase [Undibacterium sp.]|nr:PQQ-dependent sugar dehydrogenase [Opitutaceae bacterium]
MQLLRSAPARSVLASPLTALIAFSLSALSGSAALPKPDADDGAISLPPGFRALVVADDLVLNKKVGNTGERLRGLAVAPNGDLYAKGKNGLIWALRDIDGDGRADLIKEFGPGDGGTHIMFHDGWLYHSSRTAVYRYKYTPGELVPSSAMQTIVSGLPAEKDHDAKAFGFDESGRMIVEIGSPYNVLSDGDRRLGAKGKTDAEIAKFQETYGGFWRFDTNKLDQHQSDGVRFSTGHRHSLALQWHPASKNFFMVQMGRDNLNIVDPVHYDELDNAERVSEVMHLLKEGSNLGWPYSYWDPVKKAHLRAPEYGGDNFKRVEPDPYDRPVVAFPAHWAPLQMALYTGQQFPAKYRLGMFVAFHGSWNRAPRSQAGYNVSFVPFDEKGLPKGTYEQFAWGFPGTDEFVNTRDAKYRPCGVAVGPDGSLYIGDTDRGRIWRVIYTGETTSAQTRTALTAKTEFTPVDAATPGGKIYAQLCAACHMPAGTGVPGIQPALAGSKVVAGDVTTLINVLLKGPQAVLPIDREKFSSAMPPLGALYNDAELASVINFIRKNFATNAGSVTAAQVAAQRHK